MKIRKVIQRRIRHTGQGVDLVSEINAAVVANVGERRSTASTRRPEAETGKETDERRD